MFLDTQCERRAGIIAERIKTCAPFGIKADSRACGGPLYRFKHLKKDDTKSYFNWIQKHQEALTIG